MVRITHSLNEGIYPVTGLAVSAVREYLETLYGIPDDCTALVNFEEADENYVLADGDELDFLRSWGEKGGGGGLSPEELSFLEQGGLTLADAAGLFPGRRPGKKVSIDTLWRWCRRGVRNGVRLRSVLIGGRRYTTRQWVVEFIDALNQRPETPEEAEVQYRTANQRRSASERAGEELKALWERKRPSS